jgi:NAD(P)-dependent dehydrogenase (short-subunit alcohol dehydrogenase family)
MSAEFLQSLFGLAGKTAVVIGGNGVLGGALCDGLGQAGAFVVVAGRDAARGEERAKAIRELGGQAAFIATDVAERASHEALLARVTDERGGVELLVNCAGVNSASPYFDVRDEDWERVLRINLLGTHLGCQVFGRHMADSGRGGAILNIGSVTADVPLSRVFAYSAASWPRLACG